MRYLLVSGSPTISEKFTSQKLNGKNVSPSTV
jgi:hypothetical protein